MATMGRMRLVLGATPLRHDALELCRRRARPRVLEAGEPGEHHRHLALDLGGDAGDVGTGGGDAVGVDLELGGHGFPLR